MLKNDEVDYCTKCTVKPIAKEYMCEECYTEHCRWLSELSAPKMDDNQWYTLYESGDNSGRINNIIEELYDAMYSPKISPEQLINNATLPNYISVHIESNELGMIVESKCELNDRKIATYIYQFDNYKKLLSLKEQVGNKVEELYNRKREINEKYNESIYKSRLKAQNR